MSRVDEKFKKRKKPFTQDDLERKRKKNQQRQIRHARKNHIRNTMILPEENNG